MDIVLPVATGEAEQAARRHLTPGSRPLPLPSGPMSARIAADPAVPSRSAAVPGSSAGTLLSVTEPGEPPPGSGEAPEEGRSALPAATVVLAVIARPGQESADLGAVLAAFRLRGAELAVLCLTRGEGAGVNTTCGRLAIVPPPGLPVAAGVAGGAADGKGAEQQQRGVVWEPPPQDRVAERGGVRARADPGRADPVPGGHGVVDGLPDRDPEQGHDHDHGRQAEQDAGPAPPPGKPAASAAPA